MVEYRTDEERLSAIINFFNDYKKFFVWGSVGLFLITLVFISVSNFRTNQDSGVWGGATEDERKSIRREYKKTGTLVTS